MSEAALANTKGKKINFKANFILLFLGLTVSMLGNGIFRLGLSLFVLDVTGSNSVFTLMLMLVFIPDIFVNLFGSVFVDKHDRKKILVSADILCGVVVLGFMFILGTPSNLIMWIIVCQMLLALFNNFFRLSLMASIPNIVGEESVLQANSLMQGLGAAIQIVGPVLGALAYKSLGIEMIFLLNGISFILSGFSEMFIRFRKVETVEGEEEEPYFQRISQGFKYIASHSILKFFMVFAFFIQTIYLPLTMQLVPIIAYNIMNLSAIQLSIMQGSWAFGIILGSIFIGIYNKQKVLITKFFPLLQIQSVLVVLWYFPRLSMFADASHWLITWIYAAIMLVTGMLNIIQNAPLFAHFQVQIPDEIRGRVFGVMNIALLASAPVGMGLFWALSSVVDWMFIPVISGVLMLIYCIISARNKDFRGFINDLKEEINNPVVEENVVQETV